MKRRKVTWSVWGRIALVVVLALEVAGGFVGCASTSVTGRAAARAEEPAVEHVVAQTIPTVPPPTVSPATATPATTAPAAVPEGDPLVYPGSTPLEITEVGQENYLGIAVELYQMVPVRIPLWTPATFAYTRDEQADVEAYFREALSSAGWALARDGHLQDSYAGVWRRDQTNLVIVINSVTPHVLPWFEDTFEISLPGADVVLMAAYVWEAELG